jgi:hypothetical protein
MINEFGIPTAGKTGGRAYCVHNETKTMLLPPGSRHYARLECADCGAFLKFLPRPENVARRKLNGFRLAQLQMCVGLNSWEQQFVDSLAKQGNRLSPKQQAVFYRLCAAHLEGRGA